MKKMQKNWYFTKKRKKTIIKKKVYSKDKIQTIKLNSKQLIVHTTENLGFL